MYSNVDARKFVAIATATVTVLAFVATGAISEVKTGPEVGKPKVESVTIRPNVAHDLSRPLSALASSTPTIDEGREPEQQNPTSPTEPPVITSAQGA